jgi:hypothetical protein
MSSENFKKHLLAFRAFTLAAMVLTALAYYSPIWWVSLTAPQYPKEMFPDGIRIHFHLNGVFNGCHIRETREHLEGEALDCKHEMDAINHYVGMYPIAAGGPVERAFAPYLFSILGLMMVAFITPGRKKRLILMGGGSAVIVAWMAAAMLMPGGVKFMSGVYVEEIVKATSISSEELAKMTGFDVIREGYVEALGRYFREAKIIETRTGLMMGAATILFWGIAIGMAAIVVGMAFLPQLYWLLVIGPAIVPVAFIVEYSAWLWWFGHSLNAMGAFSIKPFMPTVFGQGKVAQFITYSYPHYGFGLLSAAAVCLVLAALIRRQQLRAQPEAD